MVFRTTESNTGKMPKSWRATETLSAGHVFEVPDLTNESQTALSNKQKRQSTF